jgi:hypothetical protein
VISGEFNSQDAANTLLVYARMCRKPGEWLMMLPEGRAGADIRADQIAVCCQHAVGVYHHGDEGEFNSQSIANTLWAFGTMGTKPGHRMMERRAEAKSGEFNILQTRCESLRQRGQRRVRG